MEIVTRLRDNASINTILKVLGAVSVAKFAYNTFSFLKLNYCNGFVDLRRRYASAGSWAVITGASEGIGRSFALDCARRGFNVFVIARTESKLQEVCEACMKINPKIMAKYCTFDFEKAEGAEYQKLFDLHIKTLDVGLLINNVGAAYGHPQDFATSNIEEDIRITKINIFSQLRMTKLLVPHFVAKRCGGIVNLASLAAILETPYLSTYAATKAFNKQLSNSLEMELKEHGIDVLCVTPGTVATPMVKGDGKREIKPDGWMMADPNIMARHTLNNLSYTHETAGYRFHCFVLASLSTFSRSFCASMTLKTMKKLRDKHLKHAPKA